MSAILEAIRDKPVALFQLDDTAPFQDYSGYNRSGTVSGTAGTGIALMAGATYSTKFDGVIGKFASPVFRSGAENKPFSLEAWVFPLPAGTEQQILGNSGQLDGLTINGTVVSFVTKYANSEECRASYDLQVQRRFHAVGIHTNDKNTLYVDGVLVAETETTPEQQADVFISTDGFLYSSGVLVNGLAIYASALTSDAVVRHFSAGSSHVSRDAISSQYGGLRIPLSQDKADVFLQQTWDTDWSNALLTDVVVENSQLRPSLVSGTSVAGSWTNIFPLDATAATSIYGVNMMWDGEGVIIEASLDGTTWTPVERGKNLSIITPGFDPTGKDLHIRVSFPGGIVDDPSFLNSLTVTGFLTGTVSDATTDGYIRNDYEPSQLRDDFGVSLPTGKKLTIPAMPDFAPQTVEIWAKGVFSTNLSASVNYSDGAPAYAPVVGDWQVRTYVLSTATTSDIVITSSDNGTVIGQVVLYPDVKTSSQVLEIYNANIGVPAVSVIDESAVGVTEPAEAISIYDYDWSISASG